MGSMGKTYIVTYDLGTGANEAKITEILKGFGTWGHVTSHLWSVLLPVGEDAVSLRNKIKPFVGVGGRVFVLRSGYEAAWDNTIAKREWLKKYLII